jgi:ubiquinone/menaquinone biosynthesis C-methylase UbiE
MSAIFSPLLMPLHPEGLLPRPDSDGSAFPLPYAMDQDRDVGQYDRRAPGYESGPRGAMHREIASRTADLALASVPEPKRILDVGCGTGYLLRLLAGRVPTSAELVGIDAAPSMIETAAADSAGGRLQFAVAVAEDIPQPDKSFDLIVSTTSFTHWTDQHRGLSECARVLAPGGCLVLVDVFSAWLLPTMLVGRRGKARTRSSAGRALVFAGFEAPEWHDLYASIIKAAVTRRQPESL